MEMWLEVAGKTSRQLQEEKNVTERKQLQEAFEAFQDAGLLDSAATTRARLEALLHKVD